MQNGLKTYLKISGFVVAAWLFVCAYFIPVEAYINNSNLPVEAYISAYAHPHGPGDGGGGHGAGGKGKGDGHCCHGPGGGGPPVVLPPAPAGCIPGLPCFVLKTPNDSFDPDDGPNVVGPNASKSSSGACDADFMNQIYARALIEAERENVMGQTVIRKPDSVLEYTCFDQIVSATAVHAGPLFSESEFWKDINVNVQAGAAGDLPANVNLNVFMGNKSLDNVLKVLVLDSLNNYVDTNFAHDFFGDTSETNNTIAAGIGDGSYDCAIMNSLYHFAKCNDLAVDDPFLSFEQLALFDPRAEPEECNPAETQITAKYINIANNAPNWGEEYGYVNFDALSENYLDRLLMDPPDFDCHNPAIPTGRTVIIEVKEIGDTGKVTIIKTDEFKEHICSNPSCYYDFKAKECKID